jgi:hypothetical protein
MEAESATFFRAAALLLIWPLLALARLSLAWLIPLAAFLRLLTGALATLLLPGTRRVLATLAALLTALIAIFLRLLTTAPCLIARLLAALARPILILIVAIAWHINSPGISVSDLE